MAYLGQLRWAGQPVNLQWICYFSAQLRGEAFDLLSGKALCPGIEAPRPLQL
jgi:hypothetical protein